MSENRPLDAFDVLYAKIAGLEKDKDRLEKENTYLRSMVQHNPNWKCTYGIQIETMVHCPSGFPGCSCADDLLLGQDEAARWMIVKLKKMHDVLQKISSLELTMGAAANAAQAAISEPHIVQETEEFVDIALGESIWTDKDGNVVDEAANIGLDWQPIHSAPKDTFVELRGDSGMRGYPYRVMIARYETNRSKSGEYDDNYWRTITGDHCTDDGPMPTHWRTAT